MWLLKFIYARNSIDLSPIDNLVTFKQELGNSTDSSAIVKIPVDSANHPVDIGFSEVISFQQKTQFKLQPIQKDATPHANSPR